MYIYINLKKLIYIRQNYLSIQISSQYYSYNNYLTPSFLMHITCMSDIQYHCDKFAIQRCYELSLLFFFSHRLNLFFSLQYSLLDNTDTYYLSYFSLVTVWICLFTAIHFAKQHCYLQSFLFFFSHRLNLFFSLQYSLLDNTDTYYLSYFSLVTVWICLFTAIHFAKQHCYLQSFLFFFSHRLNSSIHSDTVC